MAQTQHTIRRNYPVLGNIRYIFESPNVVKLERDVLTDTEAYFDDIMIASSLCPTYEETLKQHFSSVEKAVSRLHFHGAKLSVAKCNFAKTSICFLGWYVSKDYVIADPRRIQKVLDYTFPTNKKAMRAFLGLLNSLRKVMPLDIIKGMTALTPLTSSKADYTPTPAQREIFVELKALLTKEPLYCHLIDEVGLIVLETLYHTYQSVSKHLHHRNNSV